VIAYIDSSVQEVASLAKEILNAGLELQHVETSDIYSTQKSHIEGSDEEEEVQIPTGRCNVSFRTKFTADNNEFSIDFVHCQQARESNSTSSCDADHQSGWSSKRLYYAGSLKRLRDALQEEELHEGEE